MYNPGVAECDGGYGRLHLRNDLMTPDQDTHAITLFFSMTVQPPRALRLALFQFPSLQFSPLSFHPSNAAPWIT